MIKNCIDHYVIFVFLATICLLLLVPCTQSTSICINTKNGSHINNLTCNFGCCETRFGIICCDDTNLSSGVITSIVIGSFISILILTLFLYLLVKQFFFKKKDANLSNTSDKLPSEHTGVYYPNSCKNLENHIIWQPQNINPTNDLINKNLLKPGILHTGYEHIRIQTLRSSSPTTISTVSSIVNNQKYQYKSFATILKTHK